MSVTKEDMLPAGGGSNSIVSGRAGSSWPLVGDDRHGELVRGSVHDRGQLRLAIVLDKHQHVCVHRLCRARSIRAAARRGLMPLASSST
eukprot:6176854-Pleurochrysis_carterae.AAC.2